MRLEITRSSLSVWNYEATCGKDDKEETGG